MSQYRYRCWALTEEGGDQPWRCSLKEAVHDIIVLVKDLMDRHGYVAQMVLDECMGIEQETTTKKRRVAPIMNFYDARDYAVDHNWMEAETGQWLTEETPS